MPPVELAPRVRLLTFGGFWWVLMARPHSAPCALTPGQVNECVAPCLFLYTAFGIRAAIGCIIFTLLYLLFAALTAATGVRCLGRCKPPTRTIMPVIAFLVNVLRTPNLQHLIPWLSPWPVVLSFPSFDIAKVRQIFEISKRFAENLSILTMF